MIDRLSDALFKNGWVRIGKDHEFVMDVFKNSNWPNTSVRTGGGWAIDGEGMAEQMATYLVKVGPLGSGGDYDKLADFLNWLGPKKVQKCSS